MTCQSSPLIRVVNELCLPACTLKSDFQLPRQLQFIWLHAKQTALPYFSGSSSSVEGWRQTVLKKKRKKESVLFHFISFSVLYVCRLLRSHFLCWITAQKRCVSPKKKKDLCEAEKRHPKYQPLYLRRRCYEFAASTPRGIKMPHSKIKELICREENSTEAQWARHLSGCRWYKTQRVKQCLFNHKRFMCCLGPSGCGLFQYVSFNTFSQVSPHCKALCCAVGPYDAWEINGAVQNLS